MRLLLLLLLLCIAQVMANVVAGGDAQALLEAAQSTDSWLVLGTIMAQHQEDQENEANALELENHELTHTDVPLDTVSSPPVWKFIAAAGSIAVLCYVAYVFVAAGRRASRTHPAVPIDYRLQRRLMKLTKSQ